MHRKSVCLLLAAVVGLAAAPPAQAEPMRFDVRDTGFPAGEPTLGTLKNGAVIFQAMTKTIRSDDEGKTWRLLHEPPTGTVTLDPYVHVDAATDRIVASQLLGACQLISLSDDGGETWLDDASQCGTGDHQKLGSGPWAASSIPAAPFRFASAVYTCVNHVADSGCAVSMDGGVTWGPLITAFPGVDPSSPTGISGIPGFCGGLEGDPAVGPDGTLYLPREYCGRPFLGVSRDHGATWRLHRVGGPDSQALPIGFGANNPSVAVADDGDVYYAWTDGQFRHRVARSADRGATWGSPVVVSDAELTSTTFPFVIAGADGRVATGFIGATDGTPGNPSSVGNDAVWHLYLASTSDGDAAAPTYEVTRVTPEDDPIMRGCVGRHGGSCSGHDQLLDFNDVATLPDGRLVISYVDACLAPDCVNPATSRKDRGYLAVQVGGPTIR